MTRSGVSILEYPVEGTDTKISYGLPMEELLAAKEANLSLISWMRGEYTIEEMVTVVAWNRMHKIIEVHSADASAKEAKRKSQEG